MAEQTKDSIAIQGSTSNVLQMFAKRPQPTPKNSLAQNEKMSKRLIEARGLFESLEVKIRAAQKWGSPVTFNEKEHVKLNKLCGLFDEAKVNSKIDYGRISELDILQQIARMWCKLYVKPQDMAQEQPKETPKETPKEQPEVRLAFNPQPIFFRPR